MSRTYTVHTLYSGPVQVIAKARKLSDDDVREIRASSAPPYELALKFDVSITTIRGIRAGKVRRQMPSLETILGQVASKLGVDKIMKEADQVQPLGRHNETLVLQIGLRVAIERADKQADELKSKVAELEAFIQKAKAEVDMLVRTGSPEWNAQQEKKNG